MRIENDECFIIAELSANHGGDIEIAKETIKAAKRAGADAIKLQTYRADAITLNVKNDYFKIDQNSHWDGRYFYDLYEEAYTPWEWHKELFQLAKEEGLVCFSSPFDFTAVDLLESLGNPIYKIASFEITDIPLIDYVASNGKPIIISTGIASIEDIELALQTCRNQNNNDITLLKCTSQYPALPEDGNLATIPDLKTRFNVNVGLSDHTLGIEAPVFALSLGAKVIEKHFILDKSIGGPDAHFSLDESEFTQLVSAVRKAEKMIGIVDYEMTDKKLKRREFSRSLFVSKSVKKGDIITKDNIKSVRPGFGLHPKHYKNTIGKKFTEDVNEGKPLTLSMIENNYL
ncbi:pseudaminic acid synthase [Winogradskyella sp. UBA3174]|uniref:pseudaminic acid synthase n=1 Tax=Winogradskyella sp. UBA3174 TaxID=1947785 RepID=UPI0025D6346A|nr:pseudaminic acid synthase [Winogradskyella sp. UBA3174]|tara:strand:+ start:64137 stop:65171 length:1035 start_codon:yes stop_codon:yes gene_type:complete